MVIGRCADGGRIVRHYGPPDGMDDGCSHGKQTLHWCRAVRVMVATRSPNDRPRHPRHGDRTVREDP
jgi:hypothetical protein